MKKQLVLIGAIILLLLTGLNGCMDEKSKFIGTWTTADNATTLVFNTDNTVTITGTGPLGFIALIGSFNYSLANNQITFSSGSIGITLNYSFPQSNQLILTSEQGNSLIFTKLT